MTTQNGGFVMTDGSEAAEVATEDRGFAKLELQLDDYPGPMKTALFGLQHVLVMFTAMVGGGRSLSPGCLTCPQRRG